MPDTGESNSEVSTRNIEELPPENKHPWLRTIFAGILSLIIPGMGHMLAHRVARGLWLGFLFLGLRWAFLAATQRLLFPGFAVVLSALLLATLWIAVDAARSTLKVRKQPQSRRLGILGRSGVIGVFLLIGVMSDPGWFLHFVPDLRGFVVPSDSMCPTICLNERVLANMNGYYSKPLQRGDVVLLSRPGQKTLFIKRVAGLPGDTVSQQGDKILVNGQVVPRPAEICGTPLQGEQIEAQIDFSSKVVPNGELFVVGDDLPNSFDSRLPSFGVARASQVRGKPLFLYWSRGKDRIGCPVQ